MTKRNSKIVKALSATKMPCGCVELICQDVLKQIPEVIYLSNNPYMLNSEKTPLEEYVMRKGEPLIGLFNNWKDEFDREIITETTVNRFLKSKNKFGLGSKFMYFYESLPEKQFEGKNFAKCALCNRIAQPVYKVGDANDLIPYNWIQLEVDELNKSNICSDCMIRLKEGLSVWVIKGDMLYKKTEIPNRFISYEKRKGNDLSKAIESTKEEIEPLLEGLSVVFDGGEILIDSVPDGFVRNEEIEDDLFRERDIEKTYRIIDCLLADRKEAIVIVHRHINLLRFLVFEKQ